MTEQTAADAKWDEVVAQSQIEALIKRYHELEVTRTQVVGEQSTIKAQLRVLGLGKTVTAAGSVTVSLNRRFDSEWATKVLAEINPDLIPACSISVVDAKLTRQVVGDDIYERCMKPAGEHKVSVG